MSTVSDAIHARFDVEAMAGHEEIGRRFLEGFEGFVTAKKLEAARKVLLEEIPNETLVKDPAFIRAVAARVEDDALLEKPYIFISLNPGYAEV